LIGSIDLADFCELDKDESGASTDIVTLPYSFRATWKDIFAERVIEDLVVGHPRFKDLQRLFNEDENFLISQLTHNRAAETYSRATTLRRKMTTSIDSGQRRFDVFCHPLFIVGSCHVYLRVLGVCPSHFEQSGQRLSSPLPDRLAHSSSPWLDKDPAPAEAPSTFFERVLNYLGYFQTEACSGHHYSLNERVILVISRLHLQWRDAMKSRYTQRVPQYGTHPQVPLDCSLEMLSVTLTQWCAEKRLSAPSVRAYKPEAPVFVLDDLVSDLEATNIQYSPSSDLIVGSRRISAATVDNDIAHMVCYVDRGGTSSTYPKCEACGLHGHKAETCHPLVNYCVAQAMVAQHPDLVRRIKAAYKQFPRNARSRTPRKVAVKQLVAVLDLPTTFDSTPEESASPSHQSESTDVITQPDIQDPALFHCCIGSALITYRDQD
jgi:hypothetical protein